MMYSEYLQSKNTCYVITWDEDGQQLLDGVHGVDEHDPVLLVRELLLALVNHLRHLRHAWKQRDGTVADSRGDFMHGNMSFMRPWPEMSCWIPTAVDVHACTYCAQGTTHSGTDSWPEYPSCWGTVQMCHRCTVTLDKPVFAKEISLSVEIKILHSLYLKILSPSALILKLISWDTSMQTEALSSGLYQLCTVTQHTDPSCVRFSGNSRETLICQIKVSS